MQQKAREIKQRREERNQMYPLGVMKEHVEALDHERNHPKHVHGKGDGAEGDNDDSY